MLLNGSVNSDWYLGLTLGFVVVTVVVIVVAAILTYATRIADQTRLANDGLEEIRDRTAPLWEVRKTNTAGLAILGAAKTAREAVVAHVTGNGAAATPPPPPPPPAVRDPAPAVRDPAPASPLTLRDHDGPPAHVVAPLETRRPAGAPPITPPGILGPDSYPNRGRGA